MIRLLLGYTYFSSGMAKLAKGNYGQLIGPPDIIEQWAADGYGGLGYALAISQVIIGTLVFTQRLSLVGLIALVPMSLGILMFTITQSWTGTPYVNMLLFALLILCLIYEYRTIKMLWSPRYNNEMKISTTVKYFNDWKKPVALMLSSGILAVLATTTQYQLLSILAIMYYIALGIYIYQKVQLSRLLLKITLISFFTAIIGMSLGQIIPSTIHIGLLIFVVCSLIGFITIVIESIIVFSRKLNYKKPLV